MKGKERKKVREGKVRESKVRKNRMREEKGKKSMCPYFWRKGGRTKLARWMAWL